MADWKVPKKNLQVPWTDLVHLPLEDYETQAATWTDVEKYTNDAMAYFVDPSDPNVQQPEMVATLVRMMQLLLYQIDFDARSLFEKLKETKAKLAREEKKTLSSTRGARDLEQQRDDAVAEMKRVADIAEQNENTAADLRREVRELREKNSSLDQERISAKKDLTAAEVHVKRLEGEIDMLKAAAQSQRKQATSLEQEQTDSSLLIQRLAQQLRDTRDELAEEKTKSSKVEAACAEQMDEVKQNAEAMRLQVVTLEEDIVEAIRAREEAEQMTADIDRKAAEHMQELRNCFDALVAEERKNTEDAREELELLRHELHTEQQLNRQQTGDASHAIREQLSKKDEQIQQLKDQVEELKAGGFASGDSFAASLAHGRTGMSERERKELLQLRIDITSTEKQLDETSTALHRANKLLSVYREADTGVERLTNELDLTRRALESLEATNQQLNERLGSHDDIIDYCENLKALLRKMGVREDELQELNVRGARTEIETLRQQVSALQEEIEWLEKERRHWIHKVRLQPLLDTKLRLQLKLTPSQLAQIDEICEHMQRGTYVDDGTVEAANQDFREKYHSEVQKRQQDQKVFHEIIVDKVEAALGAVQRRHDGSGGGSGFVATGAGGGVGLSEELVEQIKTLVASAAPQRVQAAEADEGTLQATIAEQGTLLKSQASQLEQLQLTLHDQFKDVQAHRERITRLEEELQQVAEERDRFRECLVGRGDAPTPGSPHRRQNSTLLSTSGGSQVWHRSASMAAAGGEEGNTIDALLAVEVGLRRQVATKDAVIETLEQRVRDAEEAQATARKEREAADEQTKVEQRRAAALETSLKDTNDVLEATAARAEELSKVNADFMTNASDKRLLQKIVDLRKREGKLLSRLRTTADERDTIADERNTLQRFVDTTLKELRGTVERELEPCLPGHNGKHDQINILVSFVQEALATLARGKLLDEDAAVVGKLQRVSDELATRRQDLATHADAVSLRAALEGARAAIIEREAELNARKELDGAAAPASPNGGANPPGGASSAEATASLQVECETWKQKCTLYLTRLGDKEREIAELLEQVEGARQELGEARATSARLAADAADPTTGKSEAMANALQAVDRNRHLEQEVARHRGINLMLLRTLVDVEAEKKALVARLEAQTRRANLLAEEAPALQDRAVTLVNRVLQENAVLQQELALAASHAKAARLRATAAEANVRVLASEAGAYKMSAYRLYRQYVDHAVGIAEKCRACYRASQAALTLRASKNMHLQVENLASHVDDVETIVKTRGSELADMRLRLDAANHDLETLQAARAVHDASHGHTAIESSTAQHLAALRAKARMDERQLAELAAEVDFLRARTARSEAFANTTLEDLTKVELTGGHAAGPTGLFADGSGSDGFLEKLTALRDTVHAKSDSAPVAVHLVGNADRGSASTIGDEESLAAYHDALTKHATLSKENGELLANLTATRQQLSMLDARCGALREELVRAEQKTADAARLLDDERARAQGREQRMQRAHEEQRRVMASAAEHNVRCLREVLANKERVVEQLQQQLANDRARHLEAAMLDSTRLERLHEQLHRDNAALVDRFRATVSSTTAGEKEAEAIAALRQALDASSQREQAAVAQLNASRTRILKLERQLAQVESTGGRSVPPHGSHSTAQTPIVPELAAASTGPSHPQLPTFAAQSISTPPTAAVVPPASASAQRSQGAGPTTPQRMVSAATSFAPRPLTSAAVQADLRSDASVPAQQANATEAELALRDALRDRSDEATRLKAQVKRLQAKLDESKRAKQGVLLHVHSNTTAGDTSQPARPAKAEPTPAPAPAPPADAAAAEEAAKEVKKLQKKVKAADAALAQRDVEHKRELIEVIERRRKLEDKVAALERQLEQQRTRGERTPPPQPAVPTGAAVAQPQPQPGTATSSLPTPATAEHPPAAMPVQPLGEAPPAPAPNATAAPGQPATAAAVPPSALPSMTTVSAPSADSSVAPQAAGPSPAAAIAPPTTDANKSGTAEHSQQQPQPKPGRNQKREQFLQQQLDDATARIVALELAHRRELVRVAEEKRRVEERLAKAERDAARNGGTSDRRTHPASAGPQRGQQQQQQPSAAAVGSRIPAAEQVAREVRLRELLAEQRKECETLRAELDAVHKSDTSSAALGKKLKDAESEIEQLKAKLTVSEALRTGGVAAASSIATLRDLKSHKREMLAVEEKNDATRVQLHKAETRVTDLERRLGEALAEADRLKTDNVQLRSGLVPVSELPPSEKTLKEQVTKAQARARELHDQVLEKDATLLDLRFERESLTLRVQRLERHLEEMLATDKREKDAPNQRNGGASPRGAPTGGVIGKAQEVTKIMQLEGVVDSMKAVIEKLHRENNTLKTTGVSGSKHVDALREIKRLQQREAEMQEALQVLSLKLAQATSARDQGARYADQQAAMQRKLRAAEAAAESHAAELRRIKSGAGIPVDRELPRDVMQAQMSPPAPPSQDMAAFPEHLRPGYTSSPQRAAGPPPTPPS